MQVGPLFPYEVLMRPSEGAGMIRWCKDNMQGRFGDTWVWEALHVPSSRRVLFSFADENDAILFKLTFSEYAD
jgi:hypothetical protein